MCLISPACRMFINRLFRRRSKKTSKFRVTGLCEGNSPVTGEFPAQRANNVEIISIWWRYHEPFEGHISFGRVPEGFTDDKSTLVHVMVWCHPTPRHYNLTQCRTRSASPYDTAMPQYQWAHWPFEKINKMWKRIISNTYLQKCYNIIQWFIVGESVSFF